MLGDSQEAPMDVEEAVDAWIASLRAEAVAILAAAHRCSDAEERTRLRTEAADAVRRYREERLRRFATIVRIRRARTRADLDEFLGRTSRVN